MRESISPITGRIEESDVIIDFGPYEGKKVSEIRKENPEFLKELIRERNSNNIAIRKYKDKIFHLYINPLAMRYS